MPKQTHFHVTHPSQLALGGIGPGSALLLPGPSFLYNNFLPSGDGGPLLLESSDGPPVSFKT